MEKKNENTKLNVRFPFTKKKRFVEWRLTKKSCKSSFNATAKSQKNTDLRSRYISIFQG